MATHVGINGFGHIGRQSVKAILERRPRALEVIAVNDLANGPSIKVLVQRDPSLMPWSAPGVELAIGSTGLCTKADNASAHLRGGSKKVIISAPAKGEDLPIVPGRSTKICLILPDNRLFSTLPAPRTAWPPLPKCSMMPQVSNVA